VRAAPTRFSCSLWVADARRSGRDEQHLADLTGGLPLTWQSPAGLRCFSHREFASSCRHNDIATLLEVSSRLPSGQTPNRRQGNGEKSGGV